MHHEIKYDLTNTTEAEAKALADCKHWLGTRQFNKVVRLLKADKGSSSRTAVRFGLMMQGIQGYPAEVMAARFWDAQKPLF